MSENLNGNILTRIYYTLRCRKYVPLSINKATELGIVTVITKIKFNDTYKLSGKTSPSKSRYNHAINSCVNYVAPSAVLTYAGKHKHWGVLLFETVCLI